MLAAVLELQSTPCDQVRHRPRDEYVTRSGQGAHSLPDVDSDSADILPAQLDLAGMESGPDVKPELLDAFADRGSRMRT